MGRFRVVLLAVAAIAVALAVAVRVLATASGLSPRRVSWPPSLLDVGLLLAVVGSIGVAAAIEGDGDGAWAVACPPPAPAPTAPPDAPAWPDADLPQGNDVWELQVSTGVRIPQLEGNWPRCTSVAADPVTGGAIIEARGWSNLTVGTLDRQAATALDRARITAARGASPDTGGRRLFGRTRDGNVRSSISIVPDIEREQVAVRVRVLLGPEYVGACQPNKRREPCRLLYRTAEVARAGLDDPRVFGRVEVISGHRLRLALRYGIDVGPGASPSVIEYRTRQALDRWGRTGPLPCYLPGRLGHRGCPLVSPRSEPPRLPYTFLLRRSDRAGVDYRAAITISRARDSLVPRLAVDLRLTTVGAL